MMERLKTGYHRLSLITANTLVLSRNSNSIRGSSSSSSLIEALAQLGAKRQVFRTPHPTPTRVRFQGWQNGLCRRGLKDRITVM